MPSALFSVTGGLPENEEALLCLIQNLGALALSTPGSYVYGRRRAYMLLRRKIVILLWRTSFIEAIEL